MIGPESGNRPSQEGSQGELPINVPQERRELSEQEFADLANRVVREFGISSINAFYQTIRDGRGKEILGTVSERGAETEINLESGSEHMFVNILDTNKVPVYVIGEHRTYKTPESNGIERKHISFFDALDDTREYEQGGEGNQGLPAPLWAVGSIYRLEDGHPVAGIIANLKEKKMYVSANGRNTLVDLVTGDEKEIKPSERTSIKNKDFCMASYWGDPKYFVSYAENFLEVQKALRDTGNNPVNQPHTGSFIYGPMAEGNVDAYLIAREPISEQLPGWAFAQVAGFTAWEVNPEDGTYVEIKHDLNRFKEDPTEYRKGRIPMYLVTRSDQIRDEIISLIVKGYKEGELRKAEHAFAQSRPQEFDIFRATSPQNPSNN